MKSRNPYRKKSRIWTAKTREIIKYFSMDVPAIKATELTRLNHKTIDNWYNYLREMIYFECEKEKQEKIFNYYSVRYPYYWTQLV